MNRNCTAQRLGGTTGARPDEGPDNEGGALAERSLLTRHNARSRLGESNPRPTHYELQAPRPWIYGPAHDLSTDA
jgi:hypothetical protein